MASGGARNRSGPQPDPSSARSDQREYKLTDLPNEGYGGPVPPFPLPKRLAYRWEYEDKRRYRVLDDEATERAFEREAELWAWVWTTPQACAWSMRSQLWRLPMIGMWVRTFVICESDEGTAADKSSLHRFADQIGLTTAGLAEMGWKIAVGPPAEASEGSSASASAGSSRGRLKVVTGGGA